MTKSKGVFKAYLALAIVCVVWGTTYLALRVGVESIPPFLFSAIRQLIAGGILLLALLAMKKASRFTCKDITKQLVAGTLMLALGNGVIGWSEKIIPSGLAALITSILPLYIIILTYISGADRNKPNIQIVIGILLGTLGILLIFRDNIRDLTNPAYFISMLIAFLAALAWAAGSVYTKYKPTAANALTNAAMQMLLGGVVLLVMSAFFDDYSMIGTMTNESLWALGYLIGAGSLLAYPCYLYALEKLPVGLSSIYAYINPFIAIVLGFLILNERLTWITALALLSTCGGIYFINYGYKLKRQV